MDDTNTVYRAACLKFACGYLNGGDVHRTEDNSTVGEHEDTTGQNTTAAKGIGDCAEGQTEDTDNQCRCRMAAETSVGPSASCALTGDI